MLVDNLTSTLWLNALASLPDATLVTDPQRNILMANQPFCDLFNIQKSPGALTGYNMRHLLFDIGSSFADMPTIINRILQLYQTAEPADKDEIRLSNGRLIVRTHRPIYLEGTLQAHLWQYRLAREEVREEQLSLSERKYRDLFNYSQAIICTHDLQGRLLEVNPALCETLGVTEAEIIGTSLKSLVPESDRPMFDDIYIPSIINSKKIKGLFRVISPAGKKIYLLYQNYLVTHPNQEPYVVAFAQDVTDRIKAEKELKAAKQRTEESAHAKEKFLANMSHEIRTPMSGILGITALLQKTPLNPEQQGYVNLLYDSAENLLNIINDILDLGKITAGEIVLEKIEFDLIARLSSILQIFHVSAKDKKLSLLFDNQIGSHFAVIGDPTRFTQILNNLLSNAIKFTPAGGIELFAGIEDETEEEVVLHFYVKDSGIGIDENNLIKIFQPFTQAYAETTRKYGGTGLGLAITQNLIELQQGQIWVESKPKKGSTFHFTITYSKPSRFMNPTSSLTAKPTRVKNQLGKLKVLLAEDNDINQLLAKSILQHWGFETKVAYNGNEALQLLLKEPFDLVLMDIQMPEKSGIEAALEIRRLSDPAKSQVPIIALTANALKGEEIKYFAAGMNDYLAKPFSEHELYTVITRVYQSKRNSS